MKAWDLGSRTWNLDGEALRILDGSLGHRRVLRENQPGWLHEGLYVVKDPPCGRCRQCVFSPTSHKGRTVLSAMNVLCMHPTSGAYPHAWTNEIG